MNNKSLGFSNTAIRGAHLGSWFYDNVLPEDPWFRGGGGGEREGNPGEPLGGKNVAGEFL